MKVAERLGGFLRGLVPTVDAEDRQALGTVGVWIVVGIVGAVSLGLALGLAVRLFVAASGL